MFLPPYPPSPAQPFEHSILEPSTSRTQLAMTSRETNVACAHLLVEANEVTYTSLKAAWRRGPRVKIAIEGSEHPVFIPIAFLEGSGDNTWSLVLHMISAIVNEEGLLFTQSAGRAIQPVNLLARPTMSDCIFVPACESVHDSAVTELQA